jgi:hypothetical protein
MRNYKSLVVPAALLAFSLSLSGCHSANIAATISNHTNAPLSLVEVDYPSASFGTQTLAPGQDFRYRFKVLGSGGTTLLWTDATHQDHKSAGPHLSEGDEGSLAITFSVGAEPSWTLQLVQRAPGS